MSLFHKDEEHEDVEDDSTDEETPETVDASATSLVQVEGESTPKKVTTLVDDVTKDVHNIVGHAFTVEIPIHTEVTRDQIVSQFRSAVYQLAEIYNLGTVNIFDEPIDKFEPHIDDEPESEKVSDGNDPGDVELAPAA